MSQEKTQQIIDILAGTRELLADPKHWTKGAAARDKPNGAPLSLFHAEATCFCLTGAISRVTHDMIGLEATIRVSSLVKLAFKVPNRIPVDSLLEHWNDQEALSHSMMLAALDRALAFTRSEYARVAAIRGMI